MNLFSRKKSIKTIALLSYSDEQLVDFYFNIFLKNSLLNGAKIATNSISIKELMYNELSTYRINGDYCHVKNGIKAIHSSFGHLTKEWNIDWAWIMHHVILDYCNLKLANHFIEKHGLKNVFVYKYVPAKYYPIAEMIYLKDNLTREPKIFKILDLLKNPHALKDLPLNNIPVVGATLWSGFSNEMWDLTELKMYDKNTIWDYNLMRFTIRQSKTIEDKYNLKGTIKVTIGNKTFRV